MKAFLSIALLLSLCGAGFAQSTEWTSDTYKESTIRGWTVHYNIALDERSTIFHQTDSVLTYELGKFDNIFPQSALKNLKEVGIWVEYKTRNHVAMQYHVSGDWLRTHGFNPNKERGIELQATDYANTDHDSLPLLWYFATAYEHRELGFNNPIVTAAFAHAQHIDAYSSAGSFPFRDPNIYFVAVSTAYFGSYTSEPYNRKRLKQIDPRGYDMVEKAWQIK